MSGYKSLNNKKISFKCKNLRLIFLTNVDLLNEIKNTTKPNVKRKEDMKMQKIKGLWIPAEILLDEKVTDKEKFILFMILYLSDETGSCFASNGYLASIVKVNTNRVSKIISSLKNKKYIQVNLKYKKESKKIEQRQIIPIVQMSNGYSQNKQEGIGGNNNSASQNETYPIGENNKDIINNIKNKNNYNKESHIKKNNKANFEQRDYTGFDFTKLYANASAFS